MTSTKPPWRSTGIWGSGLAFILLVAQMLGIEPGQLPEWGAEAAAALAALVGLWGRWRARSRIG